MTAPLSLTNNSSFQTARYDNQAISLDPSRLHFSGSYDPDFFSKFCKNHFLENLNTNTDSYINLTSLLKNMQTEENGGEYLNSKEWQLLEINRKSDQRGRIHIGEKYFNVDIRVFVSDVDQEPGTCKNYILLPDTIFTEIRKSRIKAQVGELLKVQDSGDVWMGAGNKNKFVKVFVRVSE